MLLALAWHGYGLWQLYRPITAAEAAAWLRAGTVDASQRQRCLLVLRDQDGGDERARVLAVAAAIALDDRPAYDRLLPGLGSPRSLLTGEGQAWPGKDELDAFLDEVDLGEHWLGHFLRGQWLRASGDARARAELEAAAVSAGWSEASLGSALAHDGMAHTPDPRH